MSHFKTNFSYLALAIFLTACGGGGSGSDSSGSTGGQAVSGAPSIQYQTAAVNLTANISNAPVTPVNSGGPITSCVAVPVLPSNLSLDQTTCTISGAPRGTFPLTSYTITATGPDGSSSTTVALNATLASETISGFLNIFWGNNGLAAPSIFNQNVRGQVQQADGKIYVVADESNSQIDVMRFNVDGTLDATFSGGMISYACSSVGNPKCLPYNFLIQPDGKLLIVGVTGNSAPNDGWFALRLNADGSADPSFGTGGIALVLFSGIGVDPVYAGASLEASGNIVIAGSSNGGAAMARLLPNGTLDSTFGAAGKSSFGIGVVRAFGFDVNLNKYYLGASTGSGGALIRVSSAGLIDTSFNGTGVVGFTDTQFSGSPKQSLAVQFSDGDILYASGTKLRRFTSTGAADSNFGTSGVVTLASGAVNSQIMVQPNEKILFGATSSSNIASITRYNSNGTKDTNFGSSGSISTSGYGSALFVNMMMSSSGNLMWLNQSIASGNSVYLFGLD